MTAVHFDTKEFNRILENVIQYGTGFVNEIMADRVLFMRHLGNLCENMLGDYIDAKASMDPESLHHVYEWGSVGSKAGRLYDFNTVTTAASIKITGGFRPSTSEPPGGGVPFIDKAEIMESGISITIVPKEGGVLAFEDEGESIVTSSSVTIEHPGGPAVAGSFAATVNEFLNGYLTMGVIGPVLADMATADEFERYFAAGAKSGYRAGQQAGKEYMRIKDYYDDIS